MLFNSESLRSNMYFVAPDWPGGTYASPTIAGSRAGGLIAVAWATLVTLGYSGLQRYHSFTSLFFFFFFPLAFFYLCLSSSCDLFCSNTRRISDEVDKIVHGIHQHPDYFVIGEPHGPVIAFGSEKLNIYQVSDALTQLGWKVSNLHRPSCIQICLVHQNIGMSSQFLSDLNAACDLVSNGNLDGDDSVLTDGGAAEFYDMAANAQDLTSIVELAKTYLDTALDA